jgi:hypothetical protein
MIMTGREFRISLPRHGLSHTAGFISLFAAWFRHVGNFRFSTPQNGATIGFAQRFAQACHVSPRPQKERAIHATTL